MKTEPELCGGLSKEVRHVMEGRSFGGNSLVDASGCLILAEDEVTIVLAKALYGFCDFLLTSQ